jgi:hypothetical protein
MSYFITAVVALVMFIHLERYQENKCQEQVQLEVEKNPDLINDFYMEPGRLTFNHIAAYNSLMVEKCMEEK